MSVPNLGTLRETITERNSQLEENHEREKERNQGDGSTATVWREVEPNIRWDVVDRCRSNLENIDCWVSLKGESFDLESNTA